jgi:DNA repair ATPase RecN
MKRKWKIQDKKLEVNRLLNRSRLEMEALKQERTNALSSLETARRLARDYETLTREVRDWKKSIIERTHAYQKLKEHLGSLALRTDEVGCKLQAANTRWGRRNGNTSFRAHGLDGEIYQGGR